MHTKNLFLLVVTLFVLSCTSVQTNNESKSYTNSSKVSALGKIVKENVGLNEYLNSITNKSPFSDSTLSDISKKFKVTKEELAALIISKHEANKYHLLYQLQALEYFNTQDLSRGALIAGLDPTRIFDQAALGEREDRVIPLINSASITIVRHYEEKNHSIEFKKLTDVQWSVAFPLHWESKYQTHTGSIVGLDPSTKYMVRVKFEGESDWQHLSFTTRQNKPPVDPNKIYLLSDLYSGGQLDFDELGLSGTKDAWVKIIADVPIDIRNHNFESAIKISRSSYIYFTGLRILGGVNYGVHLNGAHDIWIDNCEISNFGRTIGDIRNGIGYENELSQKPINYDAGIYIRKSGRIIFENCKIHSPNNSANNWSYGHPRGSSAMLVDANHPQDEFKGQIIVRFNELYGSENNRFNDVIESRINVREFGGFLKDSAIHDNYLAFANDDILELDGGQNNVLVYNNTITKGYCGISAVPNMLGPSYIFNNDIIDLGDDRGIEWAAFKLGGLFSAPLGKVHIFQNKVNVAANGLGTASLRGDPTYWVHSQNNIIVSSMYRSGKRGYGILDRSGFSDNKHINDFIYNKILGTSAVSSPLEFGPNFNLYPATDEELIRAAYNELSTLRVKSEHEIPNFSSHALIASSSGQDMDELIKISNTKLSSFGGQNHNPQFSLTDTSNIEISGNTWISLKLDRVIKANEIISFEIKVEGIAEIAGIALENDNKLTTPRILNLYGTQKTGNRSLQIREGISEKIKIKLNDYISGEIDRLVFILDNDNETNQSATLSLSNLKIVNGNMSENVVNSEKQVRVGRL